jgi:hypothetical protein
MTKRLGMTLLSTTLGLAGLGLASPRLSEHCPSGQDTMQVHQSTYLRLVNQQVALTLTSGKDAAVFPAGSKVLCDRQKQPRLIALPAGTEPRFPPE